MEEKIEMQGEVEVDADSMQTNYNYVVHGAFAACEYGSRESRLIIPECHGTYIHGMPILSIWDCKKEKNIQGFGYCFSEDNPDREKKIQEILDKVEETDNFIDKVMDFFGAGTKKEEGIADDLKNSVMIVCEPAFALLDNWELEEGDIRLKLKNKKALNTGCQIICNKGGGIIRLLTDGQEDAAAEQQAAFDAANWKEGDPMPDPTQKNLQELEKNLEDLEKELENCKDPARRKELEKELESKKNLHSQLKETVGILEDVRRKSLYQSPCEDPEGTVNKMADDGTLDKMLEEGKIMDGDRCITDREEAKKVLAKQLAKSDAEYKSLNNVRDVVTQNFKSGTPCISAGNETFQEKSQASYSNACNAASDNQTKNNWINNAKALNSNGVTNKITDNYYDSLKKDNKTVVQDTLAKDNSFDYPYSTYGGKEVTNSSDVPYIYQNGKLVSANQYKEGIVNSIGQSYSQEGSPVDWPKEG